MKPNEYSAPTEERRDAVTQQIHHPYRPPEGFAATMPAIHKAATVLFPDAASLRARSWKNRHGYAYGLHGTPTTYTLEERMATLEGGTHCVLAPSGLAAITLVHMAFLKQGDEVLLPSNVYGPSREQAAQLLSSWGIGHAMYDPMEPASLQRLLSERTRLVWLEAPGSVTMEFPNLRALVAVARQSRAVVALDNTWGAGLAFAPFDMGVDLSMHALTKYPSGGGDVLMGSVVTRDEALHEPLHRAHALLGMGVGANDCELVLRSLPSIGVRYAAQDHSARALATWLAAQPRVSRVFHPALPGAPGHEHWAAHCRAAAGLFSFQLDEAFDRVAVDRFVDALRLFGKGVSWGGPMSLVVPYDIGAMRGPHSRLRGQILRLSIGLEATQDLQADLAQALEHLSAP
jgi:cystathionine beta-lyase